MVDASPLQRFQQGIAMLRELGFLELFVHDASEVRQSLHNLDVFLAEKPLPWHPEEYSRIEAEIVRSVFDHASNHLAKLLGLSVADAMRLLPAPEPELGFNQLPGLARCVGEVNAGLRPLQELRSRFVAVFEDRPRIGDRMAVLAAHRLTRGIPTDRLAGSALLAGPRGAGRTWVARSFAQALRHHQSRSPPAMTEIDLAEFTDAELGPTALFQKLEQITRVAEHGVIVFDNVEQAIAEVMALVSSMVETGTVRYAGQVLTFGGNFVFLILTAEVSGLESDGFVPQTIQSRLGRTLRSSIDEIILVPRPPVEVLKRMATKEVMDCIADVWRHAGHEVSVDASFVKHLVEEVVEWGGLGSQVAPVVATLLRAPLTERLTKGATLPVGLRVTLDEGVAYLIHTSGREPIGFAQAEPEHPFELEIELGKLIGLKPIKALVRELALQIRADQRRRSAGLEVRAAQTSHMLFLGNPGTGKTTVARLVARLLREAGVLREGHLVEANRSDLVASYIGQTSMKTKALFGKALGGVLFIDEAYALVRPGDAGQANSDFGLEAIDTLVAEMEVHRGDVIVILAGYIDEMGRFLESNPGLRSRFPHQFIFPDYTVEELFKIAELEIANRGFQLGSGCDAVLLELLHGKVVPGRNDQGNGRLARNVVEAAIRRQSNRVATLESADRDALVTVLPEDFGVSEKSALLDAMTQLDRVVGMEGVKQLVRDLAAQLKVDARRRELGLPSGEAKSLHMVFKGNSGTGKTMMARIVATLFRELGVLRIGQLIEVDRSGLVGQYLGQTAPRTMARLREALGGVLFVDEAYSLVQEERDIYGREALDTLIKGMEDHRESVVVILAGYPRDMERLLSMNEGLRSRIPTVISFPDYSTAELMQIAEGMLSERDLQATPDARSRLFEACKAAAAAEHPGNGRAVRNLLDEVSRLQSRRLLAVAHPTAIQLQTIEASDIPAHHGH